MSLFARDLCVVGHQWSRLELQKNTVTSALLALGIGLKLSHSIQSTVLLVIPVLYLPYSLVYKTHFFAPKSDIKRRGAPHT